MKKILIYISFVFIALIFVSCKPDAETKSQFSFNGNTMGTTFSVKFLTDDEVDLTDIETSVKDILQTVNQQMSTYIKSSEISQFNSYDKTDWFSISYDFAYVVKKSIELSDLTNGTLDLTVGPLVNLWGFGPENRPSKIPSDSEIESKFELVGYNKIKVSINPPEIKKSNPNIYCDLSATAKGFGVDKIAEYFDTVGIKNYLIEIGGELKAKGKNQNNKYWRIGISKPDNFSDIQEAIPLQYTAMATSGDYWNYFEENGIRYSHTINPKTGRPITHKLASVTVVHNSCLVADGLATAIDVMGPEIGYKFAIENDLSVYLIIRKGDEFIVNYTPKFNELLNYTE